MFGGKSIDDAVVAADEQAVLGDGCRGQNGAAERIRKDRFARVYIQQVQTPVVTADGDFIAADDRAAVKRFLCGKCPAFFAGGPVQAVDVVVAAADDYDRLIDRRGGQERFLFG